MVRRISVTLSSDKQHKSQIRTYVRSECVIFRRTKEKYGGLSNMAAGFPLEVNGIHILTSEALYQACRFPHLPKVQRLIIEQISPMTAKMRSKPYRGDSRPDWFQVRVKVMRWCLRVKLAQNLSKFGELLLATGDCPIVEESHKDDFWGAKPVGAGALVGTNALGRLLMELRESLKTSDHECLTCVEPLQIPDFLLNGKPISVVTAPRISTALTLSSTTQPDIAASLRTPRTGQMDIFEHKDSMEVEWEERKSLINGLKPVGATPDFLVKREWPVVRLWRIGKIRSEKNRPDLPLLSVFLGRGVISYGEGGGQVHKPGQDLSIYQVVHPGDLVLNNQQAWRGSVGISKYHGIISPAYVVLELSDSLNPRFADYLFQSRVMVAQYVTSSKGVGDIQRDIHIPWLKNAKAPLPTHDEQAAITRFLDHTNRRIERAIQVKKKLIALLNEQKQTIIHHAVTRGLVPNVPLKPSGIPWLGDIPEHWSVVPNRQLFRETTRKYTGGHETPLSLSQRDGLIATDRMKERSLLTASYDNFKVCIPDDLVLNRFKAHLGVFFAATLRGIVTFHYGVFRPVVRMRTKYFELLFHTAPYKAIYAGASNGMTVGLQNLSNQNFYRVKSIVPPLDEQDAILHFCQDETKASESAIATVEREITLLREYRARVIADVVTGKLDVREAAANLPEQVAEPEAVSSEADPDEDVVELAELEQDDE